MVDWLHSQNSTRVFFSVTALKRYQQSKSVVPQGFARLRNFYALYGVALIKGGEEMRYKLGADVDYKLYRNVTRKADRMGLSLAQILRVALAEYLERHPKENEQEERKRYYFPEESDSEHQA